MDIEGFRLNEKVSFEDIPDEVLIEILSNPESIVSFCKTNSTMMNRICNNTNFMNKWFKFNYDLLINMDYSKLESFYKIDFLKFMYKDKKFLEDWLDSYF